MTAGADQPGTAMPETVEPGWEDPPRAPSPDAAPILSVEGFEGPLDWLVEMARARKLDLSRLSILALVDAFAGAMTAALDQQHGSGRAADLPRWWDWLVLAADLAQLRSRLLLPDDTREAQAAREAAEAWRRQLVDRAELAAATNWLERRPQLGREVFRRGRPDPGLQGWADDEARGPARAWQVGPGAITELLRACLVVLRLPEGPGADLARRRPFWRAADAAGRIARLLARGAGAGSLGSFLPKLRPGGIEHDLLCRGAVAGTLIASLEMARDGALALEQDQPWQPIRICRAER